jgi:hypothetical protein
LWLGASFFVGFVEESFAHVVRVSDGETEEVDDWELLLFLFLFFLVLRSSVLGFF